MGVSQVFWHHEYWLPPGAIWEDLKASADIHYPQPQHLLLFIPGAMLLIFVQCIFESWRFKFYFTSFFSGLALLYDDFKEQIIHHITTIILIFVSYCANMIWFGMIVMLVHDASDYILEIAKILCYMEGKWVCEAVFNVFAVVFIISWFVIFPLIIYYYFVTEVLLFPISYLINAFLMILQLLHLFSSYVIIQMIFNVILSGEKRQDARSDTEESDRSKGEDLAKDKD